MVVDGSAASGIKRNKAAFGDLRNWIDALRDAGELHEIDAEVDWDVELGTIVRMGQGMGEGMCEGMGQGPWRAGETAGRFGNGSGGPGQGNGMSPQGEDAPVSIEKTKAASKNTGGPIIGSRLVYGEQVKGESTAEFMEAVESSSKAATEAISDNLVRRELQGAVKHYFGRMEERARKSQPETK